MASYYGIWDSEDNEWTLVISAPSKEEFIEWLYLYGMLTERKSVEDVEAAFEIQGQFLKPCGVTAVHH